MKLRCLFGFHKWGKWMDARLTSKNIFTDAEESMEIQIHYCELCGIKKYRLV